MQQTSAGGLGGMIGGRWTFAALLLGSLCAGRAVSAGEIRDAGEFFTPAVVAEANTKIHAIEQKSGLTIHIETVARVPEEKVEAVSLMKADERAAFFKNWLNDKLHAEKGAGVAYLICKEPAHMRINTFGGLKGRGYSEDDYKALQKLSLEGFKAKKFDETLLNIVGKLETQFSTLKPVALKPVPAGTHANHGPVTHAPARPQPMPMPRHEPAGSGIGGLLVLAGIAIIGIILFTMVIRAIFGGGGGGYAGGPGYGSGGGGGYGGGSMLGNMATGIFGAMAGNWIYDSFFRSNTAHGADQGWFGNGPDPSQTPNSSNDGGWFTGGGNDSSGDFSGGGDFGGGSDFGGGDSGGGDF